MNPLLASSVSAYLLKAEGTRSKGKIISKNVLNKLHSRLGNILPDWFIELLSSYPLTDAYIDFPHYGPDDDDDNGGDCITVKIANHTDIYRETEKCYPGLAIKKLGYFCFGIDPTGSGDPYFISTRMGDNPPVYQVYHDVSDIGEEIEKKGMEKIADTLSVFFDKAKVV